MLDENTLTTLYWEKNFSLREISKTLGCSPNTIHRYMVKYNIPRREIPPYLVRKPKKREKKICLYCGKEFIPKDPWHSKGIFCSAECRGAYNSRYFEEKRPKFICPVCGKEFTLPKGLSWKTNRKYCSHSCAVKGENNPRRSEKVKKRCAYCGKEFHVIPAKAKRAKYCSAKCKLKAAVPIMQKKFREYLRESRQLTKYYVSRGQMILYKYLKKIFPSAELESAIELPGVTYFGDIVIREWKIDIEYDGCDFYHNKDRDRKRDKKLKLNGWHVLRVKRDDLKDMDTIIQRLQAILDKFKN